MDIYISLLFFFCVFVLFCFVFCKNRSLAARHRTLSHLNETAGVSVSYSVTFARSHKCAREDWSMPQRHEQVQTNSQENVEGGLTVAVTRPLICTDTHKSR